MEYTPSTNPSTGDGDTRDARVTASFIMSIITHIWGGGGGGGRFKNAYEIVNLGALKSSLLNKLHIFQCMDKIFRVEFQRLPLKCHTKCLTHTLKDTTFIQVENLRALRFTSSYAFLKRPLEQTFWHMLQIWSPHIGIAFMDSLIWLSNLNVLITLDITSNLYFIKRLEISYYIAE